METAGLLGEQREDARDVGRLRGLLRGRPAPV